MSKRDAIIETVKLDPFKTYQELATENSTSEGYVRLVLHEEGISLREERKALARNLQKQVEEK